MPGGLLALVCYGNENIVVNGNPEMTYFYKSFNRHTHFSQEAIQIPLDGPNQLAMDAPITLKAIIPRQGDFLSDLTLRISLPDIFSKAYIRQDSGNYILDRAYEFAWVRQIGVHMIQSVTITIGGQKIQEFDSDWIAARALLDCDTTTYAKWREMVGDVAELFSPAQGVYADPSGAGYPHVVAWRGTPTIPTPVQNSAPSIPGRILRIPLGFWFSEYIGNSLPLVALQYHDVEVTLQLRPIRGLYTVLDPSGVRVRPGIQSLPYLPSDQYTSVWNPAILGPLPQTLNNRYGSYTDLSGSMRYFLTDISGGVPFADGWPLNATLEGLYSFVESQEQLVYAKKTLRYNVRQMQNFAFSGLNTRTSYRIDVHNIATRLVFFTRRSDAIPFRNQYTNLTNWMYTTANMRPVAYPQGIADAMPTNVLVNGIPMPIGRSGLNIQGLQRDILRNVFLTANGNKLFESQDTAFFTTYVPYRFLKGYGSPYGEYGLATQSEMWPVYTYSFALDGSQVEQPSGTLNTSRINKLEIDVDVEPIPYLARYTYELQVYVETLNFLEISAGLGGLKFAL